MGSLSGSKAIKKGTKKALAHTEFTPFSVDSGFGQAGITKEGITSGGAPGGALVPGFENLAQFFQQQAGGAPTGQFGAIDPNQAFLQALGISQGGPGADFLAGGQKLLQGFGDFDQDAFARTQLDRLNALARPGEESAASGLANRLFSQGRLGGDDTRSGTAFGLLNQSQERAQTERALASLGLAREEAGSRAGLATQLAGAGVNLQGGQLQNFLQAIQGGTGLAGAQAGLSESLLGRSLGATGGIQSALSPEQQAIQNLLAGTQIKQTTDLARGQIQLQGSQAAGAAKGGLISGLVGGAATAFAGRP
jgi:hypothetical protein